MADPFCFFCGYGQTCKGKLGERQGQFTNERKI